MLRLHQVADDCKQLWIEEVRLDNKASIVNHGDQCVESDLSLLEITLIFNGLQNQREDLSDVRFCGV